MFEQQNPALFVEHESARGDGEASLAETDYSATHWPRHVAKDRTEKAGKHARRITRVAT
jgi:hypothetical protein